MPSHAQSPAPQNQRAKALPSHEDSLRKLIHDLDTSRRGGLKGMLGFSDSDKFREVRQSTQALADFSAKPVGSTRKEAQANAARMMALTARLLNACEIYLARKARSKEGVTRQNIVRQIRWLAQRDVEGARTAMDQVGTMTDAELHSTTWQQVMARDRRQTLKLDVNFSDLKRAGGGQASTVYKVPGADGKMSFLKPEEDYHREYDDEEMEKSRVSQLYVKEQVEKSTLSPEARRLLDEKMGYSLGRISRFPQDWKKYGDVPDAIKQELLDFRDRVEPGSQATAKTAGIGFEVITAPDRLNLRLDENKSVNISRRNVATSRIADLLGVGDVVARSRTVKVVDKSKNEMVGNLMEGATGHTGEETAMRAIDQKAIAYAQRTGNYDVGKHKFEDYGSAADLDQPAVQKGLTSLQVLDALCGQQDRHMGNYFVELDESGNPIGVKGIDNDFAFGRSELDQADDPNRARETNARDVVQRGKIILPHMDKQLALNILALNDATAKYALLDLITQEEIDWFLRRLHDMQKAIRKEMADKNSRVFLEKDSDWNRQTYEDLMAMRESTRAAALGLNDGASQEYGNVMMAEPYLVQLNNFQHLTAAHVSDEAKAVIAQMGKKKATEAAAAGS